MSYQFNNSITVSEALQGLNSGEVCAIFKRYAQQHYERLALPALEELRKRDAYFEVADCLVELLAFKPESTQNGEEAFVCGAPFTRLVALGLQKFRAPKKSEHTNVLGRLGDLLISAAYDNGVKVLALAEGEALYDWLRAYQDRIERQLRQNYHPDEVALRAKDQIDRDLGENPFRQIMNYVDRKAAGIIPATMCFHFGGTLHSKYTFHPSGWIYATPDARVDSLVAERSAAAEHSVAVESSAPIVP